MLYSNHMIFTTCPTWSWLSCYLVLLSISFGCQPPNQMESPIDNSASWTLDGFEKVDSLNPIIRPSSDLVFEDPISGRQSYWEEKNVLNPTALVRNGKVHMIYRAQDSAMTSRLGLATSDDGLNFQKQPTPIFYPDNDHMKAYEWPGGVEDPRVVEAEDGTYIMTYTAYDGRTARLCLASSHDLINWTKHGLVISNTEYQDFWSKSGAIVSSLEGSRIIASKIDGKYWMYFGDTDLFMATSDDLIQWKVARDEEHNRMIRVLHPRRGFFDSRLVEPGPYALMTNDGILLIYNSSNAENFNDPTMPKFTYAAGQALFDKSYPYKLLDRSSEYFIHPEKSYELVGEVNDVCFVEGLVYHNSLWYLYYGTADSKIAVAVSSADLDL